MDKKTYVISDLHFGDETGIEERGFDTIAEHDAHIISNWNSIVNPEDFVWVLGDFTRKSKEFYPLLDLLNGTKYAILGNNDKPQHVTDLLKYVKYVSGLIRYGDFILSHAPIHESQLYDGGKNIHGHVHWESIDDIRYINVCAEVLDYEPMLLSEIVSNNK
jgi:calcineurin-like phosphoesterase family protein